MRALYAFPLLAAVSLPNLQSSQTETVDDKAKSILDKVKAKYEAYSTMTIKFEQHIIPSEGESQIMLGNLFIKGDKFRLEYNDQWIITNLQTVWVVLIENNKPTEVTISDYDAEADEVVKPSDIFTLYEKDFKYAMNDQPVGKKTLSDGTVELFDIIRFAPLDRDVFYHTIKLYVSQADQSIERAVVIDKEQNKLMFKITALTPNEPISDSQFTFDPSQCEIVTDMRD
jgi:outer membrane lipoprotein-sorting protein